MKFIREVFWENRWFLIVVIIITLLFYIKLPFYIDAPGGVIDISNRIEYADYEGVNGSLNLLYVTEYVATIPTYLLSYVLPDWDLESIEKSQISSDETASMIDKRNKIMLNNSINLATLVAYQAAGKKIDVKKISNFVVATTKKNGLEIGDEIVELDGKAVSNLMDIKKYIEELAVGEEIVATIIRNNKKMDVRVSIEEEDGNKVIGVVVVSNYDYELNPDINVSFKPSESGSSGGLMLAISIYNAISGEDVAKGRQIAGTGTIDSLGNVGEIAGIKYKIIGAYKNGMDVVLVPHDNYEEAMEVVRDRHYDIEVVDVSTFDDALNYLRNS